MRFSSDVAEEEMSFDINVIPLIDVLLVLLIFFMTSASFIASGGIDVSLPSSSVKTKSNDSKNIAVTVLKSGALEIGGSPVSEEEIKTALRRATLENPPPLVIVRADEHTEHGSVVRVLDLVKQEGLTDVAIATVPK